MTTYTPKQYAEHLASAGKRLHPQVTKSISRAAGQIKRDWRDMATAKNPTMAKRYPGVIVQSRTRIVDGVVTATVEPMGRGQGNLGAILEHGGPFNAPQRSNVAALEKELPNLTEWLAKFAAEVLR